MRGQILFIIDILLILYLTWTFATWGTDTPICSNLPLAKSSELNILLKDMWHILGGSTFDTQYFFWRCHMHSIFIMKVPYVVVILLVINFWHVFDLPSQKLSCRHCLGALSYQYSNKYATIMLRSILYLSVYACIAAIKFYSLFHCTKSWYL